MKKYLLIVLISFSTVVARAQNMVPNGDLEEYELCPTSYSQFDSVMYWFSPELSSSSLSSTPDYFNGCTSNTFCDVPSNYFGYQAAHSGSGYCGILLWYTLASPNRREYIEVPLTAPLVNNQLYHLEMYVSLANGSSYTSDMIGAYFSPTAVTGFYGGSLMPFVPQININMGLNIDTANWVLVSGDFVATGGESYMIIGNFNDDVSTNTISVPGGFYSYSYFYIDDVSLTVGTAINETQNSPVVNLFPNPANSQFTVTTNCNYPCTVTLYDIASRKVIEQEFSNQRTINTHTLPKGMYLYEVRNENGVLKKGKLVKE